MTPHPTHSQDAKTNPKSLTINITILWKRERAPLLSIQCSNTGSDLLLLYHRVKPLRHAVKPQSSVTASSLHQVSLRQASLSCRQVSIMCHRVKPLSVVISHRCGTVPSLANQPPKLTAVLATHHHNTLPLPANTPQNLLKTSSHSVQVCFFKSSSLSF